MRITVGCPIKNRAWIITPWFQYVDVAFAKAGIEPHFLFVCGPSLDDTETLLNGLIEGRSGQIIVTDEAPRQGNRREWNHLRYDHMVVVRNQLLEAVRIEKSDYFLSVDSDILLHEDLLVNLLESIQENPWDAVGGKVYLSEAGRACSSWSKALRGARHALERPDSSGVHDAGILMALKLMTPAAYNVDYSNNPHGEDIGWSEACREAGLKLGFDGRVISKHVMDECRLTQIDKRVGW